MSPRRRTRQVIDSRHVVSWVARSPSAEVPDGIPTLSALSHPHFEGCPSLDLVGGLRMTQEFVHAPVMVSEVLAMLEPVPPRACSSTRPSAAVGMQRRCSTAFLTHELIGVDADDDAVGGGFGAACPVRGPGSGGESPFRRAAGGREARTRPDGAGRGRPLRSRRELSPAGPAGARLLLPLRRALDMRMDRTRATTAADVVNSLAIGELTELLVENGEGRFARQLAAGIVASRPIETTCTARRGHRAFSCPAWRASGPATPQDGCSRRCASRSTTSSRCSRPALESRARLAGPGGPLCRASRTTPARTGW